MTDDDGTAGTPSAAPAAGRRPQQVFTLLIEVGRSPGDGLPAGATGAGMLCYATGVDEAEAVREAVAVLKQAGLAPLDVTGYGTIGERRAQGHEIDADETALMDRALAENAVIVAQVMPVMPGDDGAGPQAPEGDPPAAQSRGPKPAATGRKPRPARGKGATATPGHRPRG